jgi:outer membrane protein assembly factor BamA
MNLILCFLLMLATPAVGSSHAGELVIEGNKNLSRKVILESVSGVPCVPPDSLCIQAICEAVAGRYWRSGYLGAEVSCDRLHPGSDTILVSISEGRVSRLKAVEVVGAETFRGPDLGRAFEHCIGSPFSPSALEEGIHTMLETLDEHGYPAASIKPEMVAAGDGWVDITLRVDEGPKALIGYIMFQGLTKTRREVLLRECGISVGGTYDGKKVNAVPARLTALGVFEDVSNPILSFGPGDTLVTVAFDVSEARTNRLEGIAAYAPAREEGKVIGSLDLELGNIAGTLRRLRIVYDRPGPNRLMWNIDYREPRLAGMPVALDLGLSSDVLEDQYARRKLSLGIRLRREARLEVGLGGFLAATKDRSGAATEGNFGERGLSFDLRYEARDRPINPRAGEFLSLMHEVSSLDYEGAGAENRTLSRIGVETEYVHEAGRDNVIALGARFDGVFSSTGRVPSSHIIRLGGFGSLRGYPQEWFSVEEDLVLSLEGRRIVGRNSRVYAFLDCATFEGANRDFGDLDQLPYGYGFGFMGGTRNGIFRLEIALGRGDRFSEAKLHLGLMQLF